MIKRNWKLIFVYLSQFFDIAAILSAGILLLFLQLYFQLGYTQSSYMVSVFFLFLIISMTASSLAGLYRGSCHMSLQLQTLIMLRSFMISMVISLAIISFFKNINIDRLVVVIFLLSTPLFLLLSRFLLYKINLYFQSRGYGMQNSLIIGYADDRIRMTNRFYPFQN